MALADAVSVGLLECRHGRTVWANPALADLLGVTHPDELTGMGPDSFVRDAGEGLPDWLGGERAAEPSRTVECALAAPGARPRAVRVRALGEGRFEFVDVSRLRELEGEVHRLAAELLAARRAADVLQTRLERVQREREMLLSTVSHELQTPLTVMAGFNRLLLAERVGPLSPEQRHFLEESAKSCRRLSTFVANLIEAEGERGAGRPLELMDAELAPTLHAVADLLRPLARERRQTLEVTPSPRAGRARFDPARIEQVLINLIGNAIKYGRAGGTIALASQPLQAGGHRLVEVSVRDDGPGVPPGDRERIFQPFVRGSDREEAGIGLGLAISRRIVDAHGGALGVEDAPGGGSRFWFTLPAAGRSS